MRRTIKSVHKAHRRDDRRRDGGARLQEGREWSRPASRALLHGRAYRRAARQARRIRGEGPAGSRPRCSAGSSIVMRDAANDRVWAADTVQPLDSDAATRDRDIRQIDQAACSRRIRKNSVSGMPRRLRRRPTTPCFHCATAASLPLSWRVVSVRRCRPRSGNNGALEREGIGTACRQIGIEPEGPFLDFRLRVSDPLLHGIDRDVSGRRQNGIRHFDAEALRASSVLPRSSDTRSADCRSFEGEHAAGVDRRLAAVLRRDRQRDQRPPALKAPAFPLHRPGGLRFHKAGERDCDANSQQEPGMTTHGLISVRQIDPQPK